MGAVLYELVSGQRAFSGESAVETLNAILKEEPPEIPSTRTVDPRLERIVRHCMEKNPEQRFHSARDLGFALGTLSGSSEVRWDAGQRPGLLALSRPKWVVGSILVLGVLAGLSAAAVWSRRTPVQGESVRLSVITPENAYFRSFAISPDGRRLVFAATAERKIPLRIRPLGSLAAQALPGTEGASYPFWSPDSRWIGFFADGKLKKIDASGGSPVTLADAADGRGGAWSRDGMILFAPNARSGLYRVPASGGMAVSVTTVDDAREETSHRWPCFPPDGRHFVYYAQNRRRNDNGYVLLGSLDDGRPTRLLQSRLNAVYAPPGYLLFMRGRMLVAQSFDAERRQLGGEPFPVEEQVGILPGIDRVDVSVSDNGVLVYGSGDVRTTRLALLDRGGTSIGFVGPPGQFAGPALSPDEKKVALELADPQTGTRDIWVIDLPSGRSSPLTFDPANDEDPVWSPDGSHIVFSSNRTGQFDLYQKPSSGAGGEELLLKTGRQKVATDWSRDGRFIVFEEGSSLWYWSPVGDRQPRSLLKTGAHERGAVFSPDGRWLAYTSNERGRNEIYVQKFGGGGKWQVSTEGGSQPYWGAHRTELFYVSADRKLMAVQVKAGASFDFGAPEPLFDVQIPSGAMSRPQYAVMGDGQRFLVNALTEESTSPTLTIVLNWTADLKR